jgi:hypothetical protein
MGTRGRWVVGEEKRRVIVRMAILAALLRRATRRSDYEAWIDGA